MTTGGPLPSAIVSIRASRVATRAFIARMIRAGLLPGRGKKKGRRGAPSRCTRRPTAPSIVFSLSAPPPSVRGQVSVPVAEDAPRGEHPAPGEERDERDVDRQSREIHHVVPPLDRSV